VQKATKEATFYAVAQDPDEERRLKKGKCRNSKSARVTSTLGTQERTPMKTNRRGTKKKAGQINKWVHLQKTIASRGVNEQPDKQVGNSRSLGRRPKLQRSERKRKKFTKKSDRMKKKSSHLSEKASVIREGAWAKG